MFQNNKTFKVGYLAAFLAYAISSFAMVNTAIADDDNGAMATTTYTKKMSTKPNTPYVADKVSRLTERDKSDIKYVHELAKKQNRTSGPLDFSDPVQYRYFKRFAERSGATPKNAPQFYRELEAARKRHIKQGGPDEVAMSSTTDSVAINVVSGYGAATTTEENFSVSALSSTPGGSDQTRLTIQLFDDSYNAVGPLGQHTEFAQGENTQVQTVGSFSTPTQPAEKREVITSGTYNYQPYGGATQHGYMTQASATVPESISTLNPKKNGGTEVGQIRVCLNRSGSDCDITESSGSQQNVKFPIQGSITYFDEIQTPFDNNNSFNSIIITKEQSGGGCLMSAAQSATFFTNATVSADKKTLSWDLSPAQFGPACFNQADTVIYSFTVQVTVGAGNNARPVFAYVTNASDAVEDLNTAKIMPIQFRWGCLAGESLITVKRGETFELVMLKDVRIGDIVLANARGDLVEVVANTIGTEPVPMLRISTADGRSVLVTNGHPMKTGRGVVLSRHVKVGDVFHTIDGTHTKVVSIKKEQYDDNVWSLDVSPISTDGRHLGQDGTTFYADGLLVGDVKMQNAHERKALIDPRKILERLSPKWHEDYFNYIAQKQS